MEYKSIWELNNISETPKLNENLEVDIVIVGGGIAGITTAYYLRNSNKKIVLLEKDCVGCGVSKYTTGKLTYLQNGIYPNIAKTRSKSDALEYFNSQKDAIKLAKEIIYKHQIDCNLTPIASYLFAYNDTKKFNEEKKFLIDAECKFEESKTLPINFPCKKALYVHDTFCFHPLKFINKLKEIINSSSVHIYEKTLVTDINKEDEYYIVKTSSNQIKCKKVIITTNYPFFILPKLLPLQLKLEKSYLLEATKNDEDNFLALSTDKPNYTFRIDNEHFIFGGYSHNLSKEVNYQEKTQEVLNDFKNHFDNKINNYWSIHDVISKDHLPLIGRLNKTHENVIIATAFHKWGMTNGILAGKIISDIILNKENRYIKLFAPERKLAIKGIVNTITNDSIVGKAFIDSKINKNKKFYKNVMFKNENGINIGIYTDENNIEHKIINRCPHLKSSLIFDEEAKVWICPCHGSMFDVDGNLLKEPSIINIKYKKS